MTETQKAPLRIDQIFAAVSTEENGDEGVCTVMMGDMWVPLLAADVERLDWIREKAAEVGAASGRKIRLIRLSTREELEILTAGRLDA